MILYFSGTGNSAYVATKLGKALEDQIVDLFDKLKNKDYQPLFSDKPYVIVTPTYSWQIPHIVTEWLNNTILNGNSNIYFIMTCGSEIGNADSYLRSFSIQKGYNYCGVAGIVMPENYIALFNAPNTSEAIQILRKSDISIDDIAKIIAKSQLLPLSRVGFADKIKSGFVNKLFYRCVIKDKKFYATDACVGCHNCENNCVMSNIVIQNGKPKWQNHCTHCMACITCCPKEAIEYGKATKDKPRYRCPE